MKLQDLAKEIKISPESIKQFIQDFDLDLGDCIFTNFELKKDFEKFALEQAEFLRKYEKDLEENKTVDQIATTIQQPKEKLEKFFKEAYPNIYDNGLFRSSVSSFGIDHKLGGNYQFVYDYFGNKTSLQQKDFIGYRDLFFVISETLSPFLDESQIRDWGIQRPAGIVLYGPPGSGKIFWANKIAEIINYEFKEVKKCYYGTSFIDGTKVNFNDYLVTMMSDNKVLLFIDDFENIVNERAEETNSNFENEQAKEVIMHYISKFPEEGILMVGSAISVNEIDEDVLAPGRFDSMIPIFPPNAKERAEIILFSMIKGLESNAILFKILKANKADKVPFWQDVADKMKTFSNTMVIDFTQSLKKRIKQQYQKTRNENMKLDESLITASLRDAASKLTQEYLNQIMQFINDVIINNPDTFTSRLRALTQELESYKAVEEPQRSIGFQHNVEEDSAPPAKI